ncbi:putative quinol monooxygenase [Nocardioides sp. B-3]|uniref:putative quinol monooxygenase n=1 Tax=Nocardioides sp. B-3 TaxID=2895565 RepID=UPI002153773D|nr:antibiotic biosynthesis monooxygenase [Nocardioides sp. B-3]UUZ59879.1 antibiotic biosynthesis monooxygenase [Nocardioides sp. B-3]
MSQVAVIVTHQTQPGRREEVRAVWEKHMAPAVAANAGHIAYFYCLDDNDPDVIRAFQVYTDADASRAFLATTAYTSYVAEVEPLLRGPPTVSVQTPVWQKRGQN